jgi:hypothetical protein
MDSWWIRIVSPTPLAHNLEELLEPLGITCYDTDGWRADERHLDTEQHRIGFDYTQKMS